MNKSTLLLGAAMLTVASFWTVDAAAGDSEEPASGVNQLSSDDATERRRAVEVLTREYVETHRELIETLHRAIRDHRDDKHYMSPLHAAIQAVAWWRVFEAEGTLLEIIDYELDARTLPLFKDVGGDHYFPAAWALMRLRVDTSKVVDAIVVRAETDRQLQLLTWLLAQRVATAGEAEKLEESQRILEPDASSQNIRKAIQFLKDAERVGDLLPRRAGAGNEE